ncbi:MAG: peptidylprolyl isomerase [Verrucomicrobia bacterium]|nr:peptidylprolyl isomerase [Verrucomicrobiota bacterium]
MDLPRLIFIVVLSLAVFRPEHISAQIYADVTVSGGVNGNFTITLEDTKAPITVANFIGLATGQKGWLDLVTGGIRYAPFYNGVTFHRVIAGFMSQTGSRNGNGTDGPGYTFRDEIDPSLNHQPYTVSMANSGPDTNGSQWFISQGTPSHLDGIHTIFGKVTDPASQAVCAAINAAATDSSDRPITTVTISSIAVRGPSLAGFNINPTGLPKVLNGGTVMKVAGVNHALGFDHQPYSAYFGFHTPDLTNWSSMFANSYFHSTAPGAGDIDVTSLAIGSKHFYRIARVDYSSCVNPIIPSSIAGKTLTFPGLFGSDFIQLVIDPSGSTGSYTMVFSGGVPSTGTITAVNYQNAVSPYSPSLRVILRWNFDIDITFSILNFRTASSGKYRGQSNVSGAETISGAFTSAP